MNYCSNCGSSDLEFRIPDGDNRKRFVCPNCHTIHYSNPRIVAGILPVWEEQILLCRRAIEPRLGYWNVPSGYLENGESVEEGARRELWEEAIARVGDLSMASLYSIPHINQVYIHFIGKLREPDFNCGDETSEARLFSESDIPWAEIAFSSSTFTLKNYFADRKNGRLKLHRATLDK